MLKVWHKSKKKNHVANTQISKVDNPYIFQMSFFFATKVFLTLKIMDFENVPLIEVVFVYVIEGVWMHNIHDIKSIHNQNVFISKM